MKNTLKFFRKIFFKPDLAEEAIEAYFCRLPDRINVKWKRDGEFIVGWIITDDNEFMTQGRNAKDFIDMVNDAVYTVYDIPKDYVDVISKFKTYDPPPQEIEKLQDSSITGSTIGFKRSKEIFKVA